MQISMGKLVLGTVLGTILGHAIMDAAKDPKIQAAIKNGCHKKKASCSGCGAAPSEPTGPSSDDDDDVHEDND